VHTTFFFWLPFLVYLHCASCVCKFSQVVIGFFLFRLCLSWEKTQMHYIGFRVHNMMFLLLVLKTFRFR
jgi:hypothetical protein